MENCIFCLIAQRAAEASIVYEDAYTMAFMDIRPVSKGHMLIVPKTHYDDIFNVPEETLAQVFRTAQRAALAAKRILGADGVSLLQQNGKAAGQEVFHLHVHVIPRYIHEGTRQFRDAQAAPRQQLNELAEKLSADPAWTVKC
jgi:histidine triad (HIT) family protein